MKTPVTTVGFLLKNLMKYPPDTKIAFVKLPTKDKKGSCFSIVAYGEWNEHYVCRTVTNSFQFHNTVENAVTRHAENKLTGFLGKCLKAGDEAIHPQL